VQFDVIKDTNLAWYFPFLVFSFWYYYVHLAEIEKQRLFKIQIDEIDQRSREIQSQCQSTSREIYDWSREIESHPFYIPF